MIPLCGACLMPAEAGDLRRGHADVVAAREVQRRWTPRALTTAFPRHASGPAQAQ